MILVSLLTKKITYRLPMRRNLRLAGWPLLVCALAVWAVWPPSAAMAYEVVIHPSVVGQVRDNSSEETEIPLNGYLGFSGAFKPWQVGLEENLRLFTEPNQGPDDFDLYQSVVHIQPTSALRLDFGRQFVNQGFSATTLDGLQMTLTPSGILDAAIYSGIPRSVELGDFNENDGMIAGFSLGLKGESRTRAQLHAVWRSFDLNNFNLRQNDQFLMGSDFFYQFGGKAHPLFYGLTEFNVTGQIVETGTAGLDIYPADELALTFEFNYFNIDRDRDVPTILSLFTEGETLSGRFSTTAVFIPDFLDFMAGYSFQWIEIQEGARRAGHLVDVVLRFYDNDLGIVVEPGLFYQNSFGGNLTGVKLFVREQFTKRFYASAGVNFGNYHKITGNDDIALALSGWAGFEAAKGLTLSAGTEYNRNNLFATDVRGSFKVDYLFHHEK